MGVLRYIQMVLWSFFGLRRRRAADEEIDRVRLLPLVLTALALAAGFVMLLVWVADRAAAAAIR